MAIHLGDDGTLDTVVFCTECGQEFRGNSGCINSEVDPETVEEFVEWLIADVTDEHECPKENN